MPYESLNLSTSRRVLSWANHELGQDETKMAKNVASLPFVFKHVALMPDVHLGKGALVGSVIATQEAIIPAAVGVGVLDEIPAAYKPIDQVMANQSDRVEVVATLKQVVCVKG